MSRDEFAKITPVSPPMVNRNTNPIAHIMGESVEMWDPAIVAIHLKIFTPVGIAMIIVAAVK
jgi:S-adenosylmethionine/arginine decarboxylase-like enzyme